MGLPKFLAGRINTGQYTITWNLRSQQQKQKQQKQQQQQRQQQQQQQ